VLAGLYCLDGCRINVTEELKFTQRLKKYPDEYNGEITR
jgi:hypothetical protein